MAAIKTVRSFSAQITIVMSDSQSAEFLNETKVILEECLSDETVTEVPFDLCITNLDVIGKVSMDRDGRLEFFPAIGFKISTNLHRPGPSEQQLEMGIKILLERKIPAIKSVWIDYINRSTLSLS